MTGYLGPVAKSLAAGRRVIQYNQRGAFGSPSRGPFRLQDHLDDLRRIVFRCGERPIIVGHSWGAALALAFAARYPGRARGIVALCSAPFDAATDARAAAVIKRRLGPARARRLERLQAGLEPGVPEKKRTARAARWLRLILSVYNAGGGSMRRMRIEPFLVPGAEQTEAAWTRHLKRGAAVRMLRRIKDPVVALHGDRDPIPSRAVLAALRGIARLRVRVLRGMGHFPWLERRGAAALAELSCAVDSLSA